MVQLTNILCVYASGFVVNTEYSLLKFVLLVLFVQVVTSYPSTYFSGQSVTDGSNYSHGYSLLYLVAVRMLRQIAKI